MNIPNPSPDAALAIVPAGTGIPLASNLHLPDDPAEVVRLVIAWAAETWTSDGSTARCSL